MKKNVYLHILHSGVTGYARAGSAGCGIIHLYRTSMATCLALKTVVGFGSVMAGFQWTEKHLKFRKRYKQTLTFY